MVNSFVTNIFSIDYCYLDSLDMVDVGWTTDIIDQIATASQSCQVRGDSNKKNNNNDYDTTTTTTIIMVSNYKANGSMPNQQVQPSRDKCK